MRKLREEDEMRRAEMSRKASTISTASTATTQLRPQVLSRAAVVLLDIHFCTSRFFQWRILLWHRPTVGGGGAHVVRPELEFFLAVPPPPPRPKGHHEKKRNLTSGKSGRAIFGTQTFGSRPPPPTQHPLLIQVLANTSGFCIWVCVMEACQAVCGAGGACVLWGGGGGIWWTWREWAANTVDRPPQQPAQPPCANYRVPLPQQRHHKEHRPQRPSESVDPKQHAKR